MIRVIVETLIIIVCFLLQCTVFQSLSLGGIVPNLLIIITSSFGFMRGRKEGLLVGFFCGILVDTFFSDVLGLYALMYMYVGYFNGFFRKIFYPEDVKLPMLLITVSDMIYCLCCYVLLFLLRGRLDFPYYAMHVMLPEVVYTIFITVFLYRLILLVNQKLETIEKRSASKFV